MKGLDNKSMYFNFGKEEEQKAVTQPNGVRKGPWSISVKDGLKPGQPAFIRGRSCTQDEHRTSPKFPAALAWGHLLHFPLGHLSTPVGWINLCFFSCCTSLFQSTLKMKPVPRLAAVKGVMLKISHPCSPSPDCLSVSRCWQKLFVVFPSFGEWQETGVKWENEM